MDNSTGWKVFPIIRQMSSNENLFGLGSLWDTEILNAQFDEAREKARQERATRYLRDAISDLIAESPTSVIVVAVDRPIHVERVGMMWLDGTLCGSTDRVIVPCAAIDRVSAPPECGCLIPRPREFELVPLGAVWRELERRATPVTVMTSRGGIHGRIVGVWRDAISVQGARNLFVVPASARTIVVVDGGQRS